MGLLVSKSYGQIGSVCDSAHVVTTLPFVLTGLNTATSGNYYASTPCSGTLPNFASGSDYIFSYTPLYNHNVKITLSNTGMAAGVFLMSDCPDVATGCVASNTNLMGNPVINNASLTAGVTYYIMVSSVGQMAASIAFDIEIRELFSFDAAVTKIISPVSNCGLSNSENVTIKIFNFGTQTINNFDIGYSVDGVASTPYTVTTALNTGDSLIHTFSQQVDMTTIATYEFDAYVLVTGDQNTNNDTVSVQIAHQAYVNTLPYSEDFETGNGGWTAGGTNSSWELGTPAATVINSSAGGGVNSWVTNLTGNHNLQEYSYVLGPCFDFSSYQNVSMKIDVWYQTSPAFDGARIEASINGGNSWFVIGGNNEPTNWYNAMMTDTSWTGSSNGWLTAQHPLNFLGGQNNVRLKVVYKTGMMSFQTAEGFGFDNILIYECNNMPTADFTLVQNGNTVTVTNTSLDATGYLWDFGEQMTMVPDTNTNTSHTYMTPGTYNITLAAFNDCGVSYSTQTVTTTITEISNIQSDGIVLIYPNPAKDELNININYEVSNTRIEMYDILGRQVYLNEKPVIMDKINVSHLEKGIYYIRLFIDNKIMTQKVIID